MDGKEEEMSGAPTFPQKHPRILYTNPNDLQPEDPRREIVFCTNFARGYQGTWSIRDGRLFLEKLEGIYQLRGKEPLFAEWFSGVLQVQRGELLYRSPGGYEIIFEEDLFLEIEKGFVKKTWSVKNRV